MTNPPVFVLKTGGFGPSSATRTRGLMLPKHPPYQLGYTRIQDIKFYQMWSNMWSEEFYHKFPELSRGESGDICGDFRAGSDIFGAVAETVSRLPNQAPYQLGHTRILS